MNRQRVRESHVTHTKKEHRGQNQRCCILHCLQGEQIWPKVLMELGLGARTKEKWSQVLGTKQEWRSSPRTQIAMSKAYYGGHCLCHIGGKQPKQRQQQELGLGFTFRVDSRMSSHFTIRDLSFLGLLVISISLRTWNSKLLTVPWVYLSQAQMGRLVPSFHSLVLAPRWCPFVN